MLPMCVSYYLYLLSTHHHAIDYNLMKMLISLVLLCNGLGPITWKHFITEASKNTKSCGEVVL